MTHPNGLTSGDLRIGGRYLHINGTFIREIDSIHGDTIRWHDQYGPGLCSITAFLKVCQSLAPDSPGEEPSAVNETGNSPSRPDEFTLRDEANALTAYAFRNGFLEDLHAGKSSPLLEDRSLSRITDDEMKRLMIEASDKLAEMLRLKQDDPAAYEKFIRSYHRNYCPNWKRD